MTSVSYKAYHGKAQFQIQICLTPIYENRHLLSYSTQIKALTETAWVLTDFLYCPTTNYHHEWMVNLEILSMLFPNTGEDPVQQDPKHALTHLVSIKKAEVKKKQNK